MIHSMTGFGRSQFDTALGACTWELRTVNNRHLDIALRIPEPMRTLEAAVRECVSSRLHRGKLDAQLKLDAYGGEGTALLEIDEARLSGLASAVESVIERLGRGPNPRVLDEFAQLDVLDMLRWPGVIRQASVDQAQLQHTVLAGLEVALEDLLAHRAREGAALASQLRQRSDEIARHVDTVRQIRPAVLERQRERLTVRLAELATDADSARIEQELLIAAQRYDIDEEMDRLIQHVQEMQAVLKRDEPVGRRLDFLLQEFNREANTIASKAADLDTTRASVDIKVLIEQMREQVQNLE